MRILGRVTNQSKMGKLRNMQDAKLFVMTDTTFGKVMYIPCYPRSIIHIICIIYYINCKYNFGYDSKIIKEKDEIFIDVKGMAIGRQSEM